MGWRARGAYDADYTIIDLKHTRTIENKWIASHCGWTPIDGMKTQGWAVAAILRGQVVMRDCELVAKASGEPLRFVETLTPDSMSDRA